MWDERYSQPGYAYGREPNDFLVQVAAQIPVGPVLCIGEGEGRNAVFLAGRGHAVTALDASRVGLAKAEALAAECGVAVTTLHRDLAEYSFDPGAWAAVVSIWCHLPPTLRSRVHREAVTGLRPGGVLVLEAYTPDQLSHGTGGPKVPELLYSLAQLRDELAGLDLVHAAELERQVHEGVFHDGLSAVVQIVGIKR